MCVYKHIYVVTFEFLFVKKKKNSGIILNALECNTSLLMAENILQNGWIIWLFNDILLMDMFWNKHLTLLVFKNYFNMMGMKQPITVLTYFLLHKRLEIFQYVYWNMYVLFL